jgi:rare lipoprotein A
MGRQLTTVLLCGIVRVAAVALGSMALAHCSGPFAPFSSQRVVDDGEPVPKGGGSYRVGKPYNINGQTYVPHENSNYRAEGIASWYGPDFHGKLTANGEVYDMHAISAAHPTMPLPSYARVTNLNNGRSIVVRVNDRGPYVHNRIIDLSIGAAKALNSYGHGLARVRVEYVGRAPLEGSDDRMLLATLRDGTPAPAPSKVMVASAKPFLPSSEPGKDQTPTSTRVADRISTAEQDRRRLPSKSANIGLRTEASAATTPAAAFAPRSDGANLGLMSGRGLY